MREEMGSGKVGLEDYGMKKMIYVVGKEEKYELEVLCIVVEKLGLEWGKEVVELC